MKMMMENKKLIFNGSPFSSVAMDVPGQTGFDTDYVDYIVHQVPKKVGDGPYDYIMEDVVEVQKRNIVEVINSQASDVGIQAYVDRIARGLIDMPDVEVSQEVVDYSRAPTNLMEAAALGASIQDNFSKLPSDLVKGKSVEEFLDSISKEDLINYFAKKQGITTGSEVKEEN